MNLKTFTILLALLLAVGVKAQTPGNAHPKREFRAAWRLSTDNLKECLLKK
mgnify:CR=1 FL=1